MRSTFFLLLCLCSTASFCQVSKPVLSIEQIMQDPKWIGSSPSSPAWSADGKTIYFTWNPDGAAADSLYAITVQNKAIKKIGIAEKNEIVYARDLEYNAAKTAVVYSREGDIFYKDLRSGKTKQVVATADFEYSPSFSFNDSKVVYTANRNLFAWDISTGETVQLTRIFSGNAPAGRSRERTDADNDQEKWLRNDQLEQFEVLRQRKADREAALAYNQAAEALRKKPLSVYIGDKNLQNLALSPDGRYASYRLFKSAGNNRGTIIPNYVTESGFTTDIPGRSKVGEEQGSSEMFVIDLLHDSLYQIKTDSIAGITDAPAYLQHYPAQLEAYKKASKPRAVSFSNAAWSPDGKYLLLDIYAQDNKDRWLMLWSGATGKLELADRQHDDAWIGGPGIINRGWLNNNMIWFQSEATGFSHIYTYDLAGKTKTAVTHGRYEVQNARLSADKKHFYITTNEVHPGEKHFYRLPVSGGKAEKITDMAGSNLALLSPDEQQVAILHSYINMPTELYLQQNKTGAKAVQLTQKAASPAFAAYPWRVPEIISITARDGAQVYARLYKPAATTGAKPAVIFVHGAGYLQNAHKWWSTYFREYMFHNLLADEGYTVLDIDYRGSAGYGRDWRTGIYRHMGGKDLSDQVDAAAYLVKEQGINPKRIGIYGGSYGGFITLMGMFTTPGVFAAGAALRPVTDWANYNHGYTSNILNEPATDSIAYHQSSPLYFAGGLSGHLLICHGMVDINVHYQDVVKLSQRLIELQKNNWELASYPMEDHGFTEPSSWIDEYKRIKKLFDQVLKK